MKNKIAIITTLLVAAFAVPCFVSLLPDWKVEGLFYLAAAVLIPLLCVAGMILAFRATMVTWVTVLVLLAFAGNRRKVLVQRGWGITIDVAWYLASVVFRSHKSLFALACATVFSFLATYR